MIYTEKESDALVDAIEEGKIVQVSESYARREGLLILRKPQVRDVQQTKAVQEIKSQRKELSPFETFRRPLRSKQNNVVGTLVGNFHWVLAMQRKERHLTRKQVAQALGVSEFEIKSLENGVLPADDYILINKVEKYYGINLRKDPSQSPSLSMVQQAAFSHQPPRRASSESSHSSSSRQSSTSQASKEESTASEDLTGDAIQLIDEE